MIFPDFNFNMKISTTMKLHNNKDSIDGLYTHI